MYFPKLKSVNIKPDPAQVLKPSPSEEAAALSKLWKQYVNEQVKQKVSKSSEVKVRVSRGSKYRSSFVGMPACEMASFISETWNGCAQNEKAPKNSDSTSRKTRVEMLNIIAIDGSTRQVPLYKRKMKILYNSAMNSEEWSQQPIEAFIIDIHHDRTSTGEPLYTILLSDGRETMTDCSRIKIA